MTTTTAPTGITKYIPSLGWLFNYQAALVGIINALYNSGHTVVSVERLLPDADPHMDDTKEET